MISHRCRYKARGSVLIRIFTSSSVRWAAARVTLAISSLFCFRSSPPLFYHSTRIRIRRRQTESNSSLSLPLIVVQFDQLLDRCRILWLLVSFPEGDQPRKAQRITRLSPDFARGMSRRARDLVGQYLKDELRLDPYARFNERGDAGRPVIDFQPFGALADASPLLIAEPCADFGHGDELVPLRIIQPHQQGACTEGRALAPTKKVTQQDAVDGVVQGSGRVPLELYPIEISRTSIIAALLLFHHQTF